MSVESHMEIILSTLEKDMRTLIKTVMESRGRKLDPISVVYQWQTEQEYLDHVESDSQRSWKWFTSEMFHRVAAATEDIKDLLSLGNNDKKVKIFHTDVKDEVSNVVSVYFQTFYRDWKRDARQIWEKVDRSLLRQDLVDRAVCPTPDRQSSVFNGWMEIRGKLEACCFLHCSDLRQKLECLLKDVLPSVLEEKINLTMDTLQASISQFNSEMKIKLPALCQEVLEPLCQTISSDQKATMLKDAVDFCVDLQLQKYMTAVSVAMENVLQYFTGDFNVNTYDLPIDKKLQFWQRPEIGDIVGCFEELLDKLEDQLGEFCSYARPTINQFFVQSQNTNATLDSLQLSIFFTALQPLKILSDTRVRLCKLAHA